MDTMIQPQRRGGRGVDGGEINGGNGGGVAEKEGGGLKAGGVLLSIVSEP